LLLNYGVSNHNLKLKVEVMVILLRNIEQSSVLCNSTRLIITRTGRYILEGKVISKSNIGYKVYIPRLSLAPSNKRVPLKFQRKQFPLNFHMLWLSTRVKMSHLNMYEYIFLSSFSPLGNYMLQCQELNRENIFIFFHI
jgi:hypothetical protein